MQKPSVNNVTVWKSVKATYCSKQINPPMKISERRLASKSSGVADSVAV